MATERGSMAADLDMYAMATDMAARARDQEALDRYLPIADEASNGADHALYLATTMRAKGVSHLLNDDLDGAVEQLSQAADKFRELQTPWQLGRTLLELGEIAQTRGDIGQAKSLYSEAATSFEALGATPYLDRARSSLESLQ